MAWRSTAASARSKAALGVTWLAEDDTVLGGRFHDAFGAGGADTLFLDARAGWQLAPRWRLGAALRQGCTDARRWAWWLTDRSLDKPRLGVRRCAPRRVRPARQPRPAPVAAAAGRERRRSTCAAGRLETTDTLTADYAVADASLAPHGRELVGELAWRGPLLGGDGAASLFYRRDPGHYEAVPDDQGAALRWLGAVLARSARPDEVDQPGLAQARSCARRRGSSRPCAKQASMSSLITT